MATSKDKVQKVIAILKDADKQIGELLIDSPDMHLHGNAVLRRLINGYAHAAGIQQEEELPEAKQPRIELTHVGGIPVSSPKQVSTSEAMPTMTESEQLQEFVDMAYEDFITEPAESLIAAYNEMIIRGVAVKAGMQVTPTVPAVIDVDFINTIKAAVEKKTESETTNPEPAKDEKVTPPTKKK